MENDIAQLKLEIEELKKFNKSLTNTTTIPFEVDGAFRKRLSNLLLTVSNKVATSENQSVNESGAGTYSVLGIPNGFLQVNINNSIRYIPYY